MHYKLASLLLIPLILFSSLTFESRAQPLSYDEFGRLIGEAKRSADLANVIERAKTLGFKVERSFDVGRTLTVKLEDRLVLGMPLVGGKGGALLLFILYEDSYSEAYLYLIRGDRILLDSFSRSGVVTIFGNGVCRACKLRVEPLEAGCTDCYSSGCRPCCSRQISCPSGRYADCKFICDDWDRPCLIRCGLSITGCVLVCKRCGTGDLLSCLLCVNCAINAGGLCSHCCISSHCACRCLRYH
ncbi:MAG: hypothetical protein QXJ48_04530 [Candidatus Korarchaeum sp.]